MPTPTPLPTQIPTATPIPTPPSSSSPLAVTINAGSFRAGDVLTVDVSFNEATEAWDGYLIIRGSRGLYSIVGGRLKPGVEPAVRNMEKRPYNFSDRVLSMEIPPGVAGDYEVIAAVVPAGKAPTIANA